MSPWLTVTLDSLNSIVRGDGAAGTAPVMIARTVTIVLTPLVTAGSIIKHGSEGFIPEPLTWKVGPSGLTDLDQTWPFTDQVLNLADPEVVADSTQYAVELHTEVGPNLPAATYKGTLTCPPEGDTIDLLTTLAPRTGPASTSP
jgi:hypothetical protein